MGIRERSESRDGYIVRVLAVHTSEGFDKPVVDDAAALRDATWWAGSSHAIADNDPGSLLTPAQGCVPYERASWTLRSGNRWSENIELIAQAGWSRAQWLARPVLLARCAFWLADRSKVDRGGGRRIPLVKITPAQYRAGAWGVIGHHDHTVGYSDGTHWDPGPEFPWDVVLDQARAYAGGATPEEDDMAFGDNERTVITQTRDGVAALISVAERPLQVETRLNAKLDALIALQQQELVEGDKVDVEAIVAGVTEGVTASVTDRLLAAVGDVVRAELGADNDDQAEAIVARLAEKLAS